MPSASLSVLDRLAAAVDREPEDLGNRLCDLTGILADPSGTGGDVRTALEQLERVQTVLAVTDWPMAEDYDPGSA
jgi:hypothetical protein